MLKMVSNNHQTGNVDTSRYIIITIFVNMLITICFFGKSLNGSWMVATGSEDKILEDQDEDASNNERAAINKPNRYYYRNGNLSVYK